MTVFCNLRRIYTFLEFFQLCLHVKIQISHLSLNPSYDKLTITMDQCNIVSARGPTPVRCISFASNLIVIFSDNLFHNAW